MNKNPLGYRYAMGLLMLFCLAAGSTWGQSDQDLPAEVIAYADIIFYNGKILTADEEFTIEEAVAIRDGKFMAVGNSERILAMAGPNTRRVDLEGRSVIPGLIADHEHG
ncbi:MAG: amidohydrolase, partial [Acidobacteriota bacterium]|nr:amidohydrolase [Acidobacteriota bacterium]